MYVLPFYLQIQEYKNKLFEEQEEKDSQGHGN